MRDPKIQKILDTIEYKTGETPATGEDDMIFIAKAIAQCENIFNVLHVRGVGSKGSLIVAHNIIIALYSKLTSSESSSTVRGVDSFNPRNPKLRNITP